MGGICDEGICDDIGIGKFDVEDVAVDGTVVFDCIGVIVVDGVVVGVVIGVVVGVKG